MHLHYIKHIQYNPNVQNVVWRNRQNIDRLPRGMMSTKEEMPRVQV